MKAAQAVIGGAASGQFGYLTTRLGSLDLRLFGRNASPQRCGFDQIPGLPGGKAWTPLVVRCVEHVNAPGIHVLGHLEHTVKLVVERWLTSRPGQ
jgi:hypothetical protein